MPKRKHNNKSDSKKGRSLNRLTIVPECDDNMRDATNTSLQSDNEDFLDRTEMIMNEKRKHVKSLVKKSELQIA